MNAGPDRTESPTGPKAGVWPERVRVFLHIATLGRYQEVLDEVLASIAASPLAELADGIEVHVVGEGPVAISSAMPHVRLVRNRPDVTAFEFPTLSAIRTAAIADPRGAVLYLNCLGGRHVGAGWALRTAWRALIAFELLDRAPECLRDLERAEVVGIEWADKPLPHMTSNNWWARADYVARLLEPEAFAGTVASMAMPAFGQNWDEPAAKRRHAGEYWIGSGAPRRPASRFPLAETGLPRAPLGSVPWWGMPAVDWVGMARRRAAGRCHTLRQQGTVAYYRALFFARGLSRGVRAVGATRLLHGRRDAL